VWVANFRPGLGGVTFAGCHPDKINAIVIAAGDLWTVDLHSRTALKLLSAIDALWEIKDPDGWVFSRQGIALARLGPGGLMLHTRRLSWDGFDQIILDQTELTGAPWSPMNDKWCPFRVVLKSGKSTGGSYLSDDRDGWETLAE